MKTEIYSWTFSSKKEKGITWYTIAGGFFLAVIIWGILAKQYALSVVVMMLVGLYVFMENNAEDFTSAQISDLGISVGNSFYDYSRISQYLFVYDDKNPVFLRLILGGKTIKSVDLDIDENVCLKLKEILPNFLQEGEAKDVTFFEKIIRIFKL